MLNANAMLVRYEHGKQQLGFLGFTIFAQQYQTKDCIAWTPPPNPGDALTIPANSMAAQIGDITRRHKGLYKRFQMYNMMKKALKQLLLFAVDDVYTKPLKDRLNGYAGATTCKLIVHLMTTYGNITMENLAKTMKK